MPSEHQLLVFWLDLVVLLGVARGLGGLLRRLGQPAVVGELAAGLLLGPGVLGALLPDLQRWLFPPDPLQQTLLEGPAWIGVFLLLVLTGVETDLVLIRRLGRGVAWVATGSLLVPMFVGFDLGTRLPDAFVPESATRPVFALFLGTAFAISALPVIAKILSDLDLMRRDVAQMLLAAAMADDVVGWVLIGMVAGVAQSGSLETQALALRIGGLLLFLGLAFTAGQRGVDALLRRARVRGGGIAGALTAALLVALASGALTHAIGLEAIFGAFIAGIVLGRSRFFLAEIFSHLDGVTRSLFAPLFFATAGLRVDLQVFADPEILGWCFLVVAAATASKFVGAWLGGHLAGLPGREALALGAGLNARGAVQIAIAAVGLSLGVITDHSYAVVVSMAIATSMMAPPMLRAILHGWAGSPEERDRLARERLLGENALLRPWRVLIPSHGGPNSALAARVVDLAWPEGVEATLLTAGRDVPAEDVARVRAIFGPRPLVYEHAADEEPLTAILERAKLGYGAIAVGATDTRIARTLISPIVDALLAESPLPVIMVRRGGRVDPAAAPDFRRILVPAVGTLPGRAAQEMAYAVARRLGAQVWIAHVITLPTLAQQLAYAAGGPDAGSRDVQERTEVAERVLAEARSLAAEMGVRAEAVIRTAPSAPDAILALAREHDVELLVLAASRRQLTGRPFLGHGVEFLLRECPIATVVVSVPPGWGGSGRGPRAAA